MTSESAGAVHADAVAQIAAQGRPDGADGLSGEDPRRGDRYALVGVYPRGVWLYREAGWRGVLPLPPGAKSPPPPGFTGYDGRWPADEEIAEWVAARPADSNLGLRAEHGVIGIDVDAYGSKTGGAALQEAERRWGALPPTYRSSARQGDAVSGIRLYQVPPGVLFRSAIQFDELGIGHVEIIQPHHRLVVAWPSIHPGLGQPYRWYSPDGALMDEQAVPCVRDLAELPTAWVAALSRDAVRHEVFDDSAPNRTRAAQSGIDEQRYTELLNLDGHAAPDQVVAERLDRAVSALGSGLGSRYDTARDHVAALMRLHACRRAGAGTALQQLRTAYVLEVADARPTVVAESEFERMVQGAAALIAASLPGQPTASGNPGEAGGSSRRPEWVDGAKFVLDVPDETPAIWGHGTQVLWAEGESLMIAGPMGVGKSTLAGLLVRAQLSAIPDRVLDLSVARCTGKVLYLAMDRPAQIARSMHRQFTSAQREVLLQRLVIRQGPPPADIARHPEMLAEIATRAGADTVYLDSVKDAAIGLADDAVGAGYNRARQQLLAEGIQLCELHHVVKKAAAAPGASDVYGSTFIANGTGSIIMLSGEPGDPIVGFRHVRQPAEEVGPLQLSHLPESGELTVHHQVDLVALVKGKPMGITAKEAAAALFSATKPSQSEVEKARRKLAQLTATGVLRKQEGTRGGPSGGDPARWFAT